MTNDKGIFIKNIYYMLSYAFQILKQSNYEDVAAEEFDKVQDLFAAILAKGVAKQLKQGLYREYVTQHETLSVMRGKLDMAETIRNRIQRKQKLACEFDELSENNLFNQILKTTMHYLVRDIGVSSEHKLALNKLLVFFDGISLLEPSSIEWGRLHYQRNNKNYEMLLNICYFVLDGMLQTTEKGDYKMATFSDEHMARLYEKFILEYYRQHHTYLSEARAAQVKWDLQGENDEAMIRFLPVMQTDIFLRLNEKVLILDAKYYCEFVRIEINPNNKCLLVIPVTSKDKDSIRWIKGQKSFTVRNMESKNFGDLLYSTWGLNPECNYRTTGKLVSSKGKVMLLFNFSDAEMWKTKKAGI